MNFATFEKSVWDTNVGVCGKAVVGHESLWVGLKCKGGICRGRMCLFSECYIPPPLHGIHGEKTNMKISKRAQNGKISTKTYIQIPTQ